MTADTLQLQFEQGDNIPNGMQLGLPFVGFYETIHSDEPDIHFENELNEVISNGKSVDTDKAWDLFHETDWAGYRKTIAVDYAQWLIGEVLGKIYPMQVRLLSPRQYNFVTDRVEITINEKLMGDLSYEYFKENDLLDTLREHVHDKHASYDGFISFVNNEPDDEMLFNSDVYKDDLFFIYACHKMDIDPVLSVDEFSNRFYEYAVENGLYSETFWRHAPSALQDLLYE